MPEIKTENIVEAVKKERKAKFGLICINNLIMNTPKEDLNHFATNLGLKTEREVYSKTGFLLNMALHYYKVFHNSKELEKTYKDVMEFMGENIFESDIFKDRLIDYDFFSQRELIDAFADFCADLEISVFDASIIEDYHLDLYLTRRTPLLRTESVIVRPGHQLDQDSYQDALDLLDKSGEIATWKVFVTTPYGAYRIGFDKLVADMEGIGAWLYIVDPTHSRIFGVTKGSKSKSYDTDMRDDYMNRLPHKSIRSPSQVVKISKFDFSESDSYNSKDFSLFELITEDEYTSLPEPHEHELKYHDMFKTLLIIDIESGIALAQFISQDSPTQGDLISSFLTAMDSFVTELSGETTLKEINYQGLFIQAAYGKLVKIALFLDNQGDLVLKERLEFFIKYFEEKYKDPISEFRKTGKTSVIEKQEVRDLAQRILGV